MIDICVILGFFFLFKIKLMKNGFYYKIGCRKGIEKIIYKVDRYFVVWEDGRSY